MSRPRAATRAWFGAPLMLPLLFLLTAAVTRAAAPPTVASVNPACCNGGDAVTLAGSGFSLANKVTFGGANATSFTVANDTTITAVAPPGVGNTVVDVVVTTPSGASPTSTKDYFYYGTPAISSAFSVTAVMPNCCSGGDTVTITGTSFRAVTRVTFGGGDASSFRVLSNTSITAVVPPGEGNTTVDVQVMSREGSSLATERDYFYYGTAAPAAAASPTPVPGLPAAGAGRDPSAAALVASLVLLGLAAAPVLRRQVRLRR